MHKSLTALSQMSLQVALLSLRHAYSRIAVCVRDPTSSSIIYGHLYALPITAMVMLQVSFMCPFRFCLLF